MVTPADSTVIAIRKKVRRLTASASESALSTADIDNYINVFYSQDFPYAIKIDQMRSVYTFFTTPYVDRYPIDVNYNQGLRDPVYVDGLQGSLFKDRQQFYNIWPRWPTKFQSSVQSGTITGVNQPTSPAQIVTNTGGLATGDKIYIADVVGMTELNDTSYTITVVNSNLLTLDGIDNTAFSAYTSGGTWTKLNYVINVPGPFIRNEVTVGCPDITGGAIQISDDGYGNLLLDTPNGVVSVPPLYTVPATAPIPGMKNVNTANPGLNRLTLLGPVDYVTGSLTFDLSLANAIPVIGGTFTIYVSQYSNGRPYSILFWNNELIIRPIPKLVHKIEIESYLTPVQFMNTTDSPILNQWWQYIAIGASIKVLEDRQDMAGIANLALLFDRQEGLVLERQGVEEIGQRNATIFSSSVQSQGWNQSWGNWGY